MADEGLTREDPLTRGVDAVTAMPWMERGGSAGLSACFRAANQVKTNWRYCLRRPLTKSKRFPAWSTQRPRSCEFA